MHHQLHLLLLRAAITYHAGLDLQGRIFAQWNAGFRDRQEDDAAGVRKLEGRLDVLRVEHLLDRRGRGLMAADHFAKTARDLQQPDMQSVFRAGGDAAGAHETVCAAIALHQAVARVFDAAVDAQHPHLTTGQSFQFLFVDVEVGADILDVVVFFERLGQAEHSAGALAFQLDQVLGDHRDFGLHGWYAGLLNRVQDRVMTLGRGEDGPLIFVAAEVLGAGVESDIHKLIFAGLVLFDHELALTLEHPGNAALFAEVAAILGKDVADFADGAIAVVGGDVDQDGGASGSVSFEHDLVDLAAFELTGATHDGLLDVVSEHAFALRRGDGGAQAGVAVGVAAIAGGDGNFLDEAGELIPALGVEGGLFVLDGRPFRMS